MTPLTEEQALVLTGFTGVLCVSDFSKFHADLERRLGRPVFTHQIPALREQIKQAYIHDFMELVPK